MSEIKVNKISPRTNCGTTQLGDSGDTFTIPSGVTISNSGTASGFGSTGEVSWNTTKITADPGPAVSGVGYFTDTSGAAFNVTLPSSPSAGAVIAVADYGNTWNSKNLTILRNGSNIEGAADNFVCNVQGAAITFVYVDATKGWVATNSGNSVDASAAQFITATGGTETTSGDFKIHTFTGPGTFCVSAVGNPGGSTSVDYVVVAGGGAGGSGNNAGGGGAGGYRESPGTTSSYTASPLGASPAAAITVTASAFPITVGGGGAQKPAGPGTDSRGTKGSNSTFSTITSTGGGGGAVGNGSTNGTPGTDDVGEAGGSGGGGAYRNYGCSTSAGGAGNTPSVTPPQGNTGGSSSSCAPSYGASGGGGAGAVGTNGSGPAAGPGGAGVTSEITGSPVARAGGGGGGTNGPQSTGGTGGGGAGAPPSAPGTATAGTANTGGGGGGGSNPVSSPAANRLGGAGGSGIVIIRYKFQ